MFRFLAVAATAVAATMLTATPASAGETPGTYANWAFDGLSGLSDVVYPITIEQHPGQQSQIYWSNQVSWTNGRGGYAGMQTNADASRNLFLFSVWDVTEATPGSAGSWCQAFGGEGEGMSCRIWHKWTAGQTYRFHYRSEGNGWWGLTITTTGTSFKLGSIRVGGDQLRPSSVNWVEYYRWSDSRSSCLTEPYSRALFGTPTGNNGTVTARFTSGQVNGCPGFPSNGATVVNTSAGARQTLGIGNSVMGPLGAVGKCADVAGADVVLWGCHGGGNQAWVLANDGTVRAKDFSCLDIINGSRVATYACHAGANQQWRASGGTLVNPATGKCLDTQSGATADGTVLVINTCSGAATQRWTTPTRPA